MKLSFKKSLHILFILTLFTLTFYTSLECVQKIKIISLYKIGFNTFISNNSYLVVLVNDLTLSNNSKDFLVKKMKVEEHLSEVRVWLEILSHGLDNTKIKKLHLTQFEKWLINSKDFGNTLIPFHQKISDRVITLENIYGELEKNCNLLLLKLKTLIEMNELNEKWSNRPKSPTYNNQNNLLRNEQNILLKLILQNLQDLKLEEHELDQFLSNLIKEEENSIISLLIIVFILSSIIIVIAGILTTLHFSKPLLYLKNKVINLGQGDLDTPIDLIRFDEIGALSEGIDNMRIELKKSQIRIKTINLHLEKKVEERTKSLKERINEIEKFEKEISDQRNFLSALFETMDVGVIVVEEENSIISSVNLAVTKITGKEKENFIGKSYIELFCTENNCLNGEICPIKQKDKIIETGLKIECHISTNFNTTFKSKRKNEIPVLISFNKCKQSNKAYILASFIDLSEIKKLQSQKEQIQKHLFHSNRLATIGSFASGIIQGMTNPLMILKGNLELLKEDVHSNDNGDKFIMMENALNKLNKMIFNLNSSIYQNLNDKDEGVQFNVNELIREAYTLLKPILAREGISLEINLTSMFEYVEGEGEYFFQMILNFIVNAKDAILAKELKISKAINETKTSNIDRLPPASTSWNLNIIMITSKNESDQIIIVIEDTGIGIENSHQDKIFDTFYANSKSDSDFIDQGFGISLATSYSFIQKLHGNITTSSTKSSGTKFTIELPSSHPIDSFKKVS